MIALSERVIHGRVIAQRAARGGPEQTIYTVTTLQIIEDLTGVEGSTVEIWELGGRIGDEFLYVGGAVEYRPGAEVLVCLERGPLGFRSIAMGFSKFDVQGQGTGIRELSRNTGSAVVIGGAVTARERTLAEFRDLALQVTGRRSRSGIALQSNALPADVSEPFTLLGGSPGWRWAEVDLSTPIIWFKNTSAAAPLLSGDGVSEIQTSLAAWTNPPTARIALQYGGTTFQSSAKGPWTGVPAASGVVTFEDPNDEISGLTIAIGGGAGFVGTGGTANGNTFNGFTRGYVIFQNAVEMDSSFRQALNFTRVLVHELGHAIGLGHTQSDGSVANAPTNIMYPSCCAAETPAPPAIGPDDLAGLNYIYPVDASCTYSLSPTSATMVAAGGSASVAVTAPAGCGWTASSSTPSFLSITSSTSGTGSGSVTYSATANGPSPRLGSLTIAGQTFTLDQFGSAPIVSLDATSLYFGATLSGTVVTAQTSAQPLHLSQTAGPAVSWTVASNQPWLVVSPTSGTGARELSVSVLPGDAGPPATLVGQITITLTGAGNVLIPVGVNLRLMHTGTSVNSFGVVDTPVDNSTGLTGAIPFTGWALDDVEVANVFICRSSVVGESAPTDAHCGGAAQIFLGTGVFIEGARPDVQAAFPTFPWSRRAGWGFMVLTNMLPNQGNGVFVFHMYATDRDGHVRLLGTRTLTCDNANATRPFGAIDTPAQGDSVLGSAYVNFGWALTQQPKIIPVDGSTINVYVDGILVGPVSYNHFRSDIATLFPGYANTNGAVGFRIIDTTLLTNGLHTIVWNATDSAGMTGGLGSRYFRVANSSGAVTMAEGLIHASAADIVGLRPESALLRVRRGWAPAAPWRLYGAPSGTTVVRGEELDRFEFDLGPAGRYSGYLWVGDRIAELPVGSRLDGARFTWSPGLGFVGTYDLVFVRWDGDTAGARKDVRVILHPKGNGHVGPQTVIDTPGAGQAIEGSFVLAGWAIDLNAGEGTGVDTVHAWAYPLTGGAPIFLGRTNYAASRPDVAAVYGEQFRQSGYGLNVDGLVAGAYDIAVFAWSTVEGDFVPAKLVRINVK